MMAAKDKFLTSRNQRQQIFGVLFISSQSAFCFHQRINHARHKHESNKCDITYPKECCLPAALGHNNLLNKCNFQPKLKIITLQTLQSPLACFHCLLTICFEHLKVMVVTGKQPSTFCVVL